MPEELVAIKVASGNWGGARIEDVKAVADSVVHSFRESLIDSTSIRIRLEPTATANDNPIALSQFTPLAPGVTVESSAAGHAR